MGGTREGVGAVKEERGAEEETITGKDQEMTVSADEAETKGKVEEEATGVQGKGATGAGAQEGRKEDKAAEPDGKRKEATE